MAMVYEDSAPHPIKPTPHFVCVITDADNVEGVSWCGVNDWDTPRMCHHTWTTMIWCIVVAMVFMSRKQSVDVDDGLRNPLPQTCGTRHVIRC